MGKIIISAAVLVAVLSVSFSTHAAPPQTMNYQGVLKSSAGVPYNGAKKLTFSIYNVATGGTALWTEIQPAVNVAKGQFSVTLGAGTPSVPLALPFDVPYWLGVTVDPESAEMSPRQPLTTVPYAFRAKIAESLSASSTLTLPANGLAVGTNQLVVSGGSVGIGTTSPETKLQVSGGAIKFGDVGGWAANSIQFEPQTGFHRIAFNDLRFFDWVTGNDNITFKGGKVGIGTTSPTSKLTVAGAIETTSGGIKFPDGTVQSTASQIPPTGDCADGRYEDNGNGTVSDCRTGLIWLKNANCTDTSGGVIKSAGSLQWQNAVTWAAGLGNNICGLSDGSSAGDWRMPTKTELMAMIESARKQGFTDPVLTNRAGTAKWTHGDLFDYVLPTYYWSSSTSASGTTRAWFVYMGSGYVFYDGKTNGYYVWPVRSGQ